MQLVLASGNRGKIREFKEVFGENIKGFGELIEPFEIEESANSFAGNALIKAREIYKKLGKDYIVISDDSGISVPALGGVPGIYSARYAGKDASDKDNLYKLIEALKKQGIERTQAFYTAAIAIVSELGEYVVHGWMYGEVIAEARGEKGFGYDPMFIPEGFENTLGEIEGDIKKSISHRAKAISRVKPIIDILNRRR